MSRKRKVLRIAILGFLGFVALSVGFIALVHLPYSSKIPRLPESQDIPAPVADQISEALTRARRFPSAENLGMLGMVYHASARYEQAAQCYQLAVKRDSSAWIWNYYLAYLNLEMGDSEEVIAHFKSVIEKHPGASHAWYYLGEQYRNLRKNGLAKQSFSKITGIQSKTSPGPETGRYDYFPLGTYAMYQLARLYVDTDRLDMAEQTLEEIIEHHRSYGPAYRLMGNIYRRRGDMSLSKTYGERANDLLVFSAPVDTLVDRLVLLSRSELYLLKKIDEAEKSIYPEWAMKLVNHALAYMPENPYLISKAIRICLMSGRDEQASSYVDQHLGFYRNDFTEMNDMGILFFQKRMYPQSMKYLTRALELKPQDPEIHKPLAIVYWTSGDRQKAREILDGMALQYWDDPDELVSIANLRFDLGDLEKAMAYLTRLNQISPDHPKVQKLNGMMAEKEGQVEEAIAWYESSLEEDPEDISTIRNLGKLLVRQQRWDRYIRLLRSALEYHPNDPYFLERLGTMLVTCPDPACRNTREGRYFSERAFIHTGSSSMTLVSAGRSLALAYAELGDKQNAWTIINMTLNAARRDQISPSRQEELQSIARTIQSL